MKYPTRRLSNTEKIDIDSIAINYFLNYYPKSMIEGLSDDDDRKKYTKMIWDLKNGNKGVYSYFAKCILSHIKELRNEEWIACSIPGHDQIYANANNMDRFLKEVYFPSNIHLAVGLIVRNKAMPEKHKSNYGERTVEKDLHSFKIGNTRNIKGQNIIIFDDITTSGCSLNAARQFLIGKGAKRVVLIAFGKTVEENGKIFNWLF